MQNFFNCVRHGGFATIPDKRLPDSFFQRLFSHDSAVLSTMFDMCCFEDVFFVPTYCQNSISLSLQKGPTGTAAIRQAKYINK